jgi:hypothetical protein
VALIASIVTLWTSTLVTLGEYSMNPSLEKVPPDIATLIWWLAVVKASMGTSGGVCQLVEKQ